MSDSIPPTIPHKQCVGECQRFIPATPEFFHHDKHQKDSLRPVCKECVRKHGQAYRAQPAYLEHKHAYMKAYHRRPDVHERRQVYGKAYHEVYRNRPGVQEHQRSYNKARWMNLEVQERSREQKRTNYHNRPGIRERILVRNEAYRSHPGYLEHKHAYMSTYHQVRKIRPGFREWRRVNSHHRRARNRKISGTHTAAQVHDMLIRHRYCCYFCHDRLRKDPKRVYGYDFHIEHTFPLSRVIGTDIPANDMSYLVPACSPCNLRKGKKFPWEWSEGGRLL